MTDQAHRIAPEVRIASPVPRALSTPAPAGARWAPVMRLLRRAHLYSGIALLPWVLIYGVSAYLFNHGAVTPSETLPIPADRADRIEANAIAERLLEALKTPEPVLGHETQGNPAAATLRGSWTFELRRDEQLYRLTMPVDGTEAQLGQRSRRRPASTDLPTNLFAAERDQAHRQAEATLAAAGIAPKALRLISGPTLSAPAGDSVWSCNLARDRAQPTNSTSPSAARILKRLHVMHGYSRPQWQRTAWAVVVDIMAGAMVLWSFSGALMWWQKRSLRRAGSAALISAAIVLFVLVLALWDSF